MQWSFLVYEHFIYSHINDKTLSAIVTYGIGFSCE